MTHPLQVSATAGKADLSRSIDTSQLEGKSVLITGGASGLGAGFARAFGKAGAYVTIADIQEELGQKYAAELKEEGHHVTFVHTDVTNWASQVNAFKVAINHSASKSVDVVVAAAGVIGSMFLDPLGEPASLDRDPPEPSTGAINVNLSGVYNTSKLATHYCQLNNRSGGADREKKSLIVIASIAGYLEIPWAADYQASKFGVRGIFKSIRNHVARMGVRMNLIAPWFVTTPMTAGITALLEQKGYAMTKVETVVEAVIRCATDESIAGRAIGVAPSGPFDLRDDAEGLDGGIEANRFVEDEVKGYEPALLDIIHQIQALPPA